MVHHSSLIILFDSFSSDVGLLYILCRSMMCMKNWFDGLLMATCKNYTIEIESEENNGTLMWCNFFCFWISISNQIWQWCVRLVRALCHKLNRFLLFDHNIRTWSMVRCRANQRCIVDARNNNGLAMLLSTLVHPRIYHQVRYTQRNTREEFRELNGTEHKYIYKTQKAKFMLGKQKTKKKKCKTTVHKKAEIPNKSWSCNALSRTCFRLLLILRHRRCSTFELNRTFWQTLLEIFGGRSELWVQEMNGQALDLMRLMVHNIEFDSIWIQFRSLFYYHSLIFLFVPFPLCFSFFRKKNFILFCCIAFSSYLVQFSSCNVALTLSILHSFTHFSCLSLFLFLSLAIRFALSFHLARSI